ncbi:Retrovirus-related Pol poly from transposon [Paramuricea clavata]|uniref:Retrovirus-related Pol poly from transposon n=1 Tax=Paramuricea clavata TaxID=317549 RepID=A0A7D9EJL7_PARCT|nr:Retrovirus-related Pol poly from transposon [Paramuricea clavata]
MATVKDYCATCPQCQLVARKSIMSRAPLNPVPTVSEPFKKIAIDLIGELPKTKTGYKYVLTLIDYATRYPEAIPLKTTHSRVIAEALISVFSRVGLPNEIVSDQGSNLIGQLMKQLYELLGISRIKTSVYYPEANGLVDGTLKHMLKKFVANQIDN